MTVTTEKLDAILPQTQCQLCGFAGCKPYAEALTKNEADIDLCLPGGVKGLLNIAELVGKDPTPYLDKMTATSKPMMRAVIRETECIGCTKCIQACPVDAILGTGKWMHTVIADECTGCELCVSPCPVDCIDMVLVSDPMDKKDHYRKRYDAREARLKENANDKPIKVLPSSQSRDNKKAYITAALLRAKMKKDNVK